MSDALVTVMETKYHYDRWRPETAIREGALDGNSRTDPDPSYVPFIVAPCFPSYPSAHASASYSAREILARIFGNKPHSIALSTSAMPGFVLHYQTLSDITDDIDDARIYGGIHVRYDTDAGRAQTLDVRLQTETRLSERMSSQLAVTAEIGAWRADVKTENRIGLAAATSLWPESLLSSRLW